MLDMKLSVTQRREREGVEVVLKKEGKPAILLALSAVYVAAVLLAKKMYRLQELKSILGVTIMELQLDQQLCWFISLLVLLKTDTTNEHYLVQYAVTACV